jgi:16S rRNA (guanine527-N7)-methyltransferase
VTAECAAPLLAVGGLLVVSEPPDGRRWPASALEPLGMAVEGMVRGAAGTFQRLRQVTPCPDRYPRRVGIPAKRPLFD